MDRSQQIHRLGEKPQSLPPRLEGLISYWLQKCASRPMPSRDELPLNELRPWLGQLALIDVSGDQRVRLCGTNLIRRFGREATGLSVSELAPDIACQLRAILKAASKSVTPILAVSHVQLGREWITYSDVGLPLADAGGLLSTVLFGSYQIKGS